GGVRDVRVQKIHLVGRRPLSLRELRREALPGLVCRLERAGEARGLRLEGLLRAPLAAQLLAERRHLLPQALERLLAAAERLAQEELGEDEHGQEKGDRQEQ